MVRSRRMAWLPALVIAGVALIGTAVLAADDVKTGIVDIEKVYKDAPRLKQYNEELNKFFEGLKRKLDVRQQNMMLSDDEVKELVELKTKDGPNDKDKARIDVLEKTDRDRDAELKTLQSTKDLNDQQKARQNELQAMRQKSGDTGEALQKDYENLVQSKNRELMEKAEGDLRAAITKVAAAKGLTLVVAKEAVLFGGSDITDAVIKELDRK